MSCEFETHAYAKWLLSGEHAVVRGFPAIVFPIPDYKLTLRFQNNEEQLRITAQGFADPKIEAYLPELIQQACQLVEINFSALRGKVNILNTIPTGGGLGLSAAISVVIARFLQHLYPEQVTSVFELAKSLEDIFHIKSSGVDIAGAMSESSTYYQIGQEPEKIEAQQQFYFSLHYSGIKSHTKSCVAKVMALFERSPDNAQQYDEQMAQATVLAKKALQNSKSSEALLMMKQAIELAKTCFENWDLISTELKQTIEALKKEGALAVKPTGSGEGGYVLALWDKPKKLI